MNKFIRLERGKPYPLPTTQPDAAAANFLADGSNVLQISLDPISAADELALRNGIVKSGLLAQDTAILFLFQFLDKQGSPLFTFDCPFDARLIPVERLSLPSMETTESRLLLEVHAVDGKGILRALRGLTLPLPLSTRFLSAAMDQLSANDAASRQKAGKRLAFWQQRQPEELAKALAMEVCGR